MANWIYNLLHGKLPGKGFLGRSSTGSGPGELLDPAAARALLELSGGSVPFDLVTSSRSLTVADTNKGFIRAVHATTDIVLTIPTGTFTAGTGIMIARSGAALVTITAANGVTLNSVVSTGTTHADLIDVYQAATLMCVDTNVFEIYGSHGGVA